MENLKEELNKCLDRNVPFVFYRKPNSEVVKALIQNDASINFTAGLADSGFVFAPFDDREKSYLIRKDNSVGFSFPCKRVENKSIGMKTESSKDAKMEIHIDLVQKAIDLINNSDTQKIVLSRKEIIHNKKINIFDVLKKLLNHYQQAFVYVWFHPMTGLWMGATPETLLEVKDNKFKTMALAATQSYKGTIDTIWNTKERQEQNFVTNYIQLKLKDLNVKISKPFTIKAGSLLHICSEIEGELSSAEELYRLVNTLHPTPAVCGIPKEKAKQFILKNENYNREFYTGFLGEISSDSIINLYVNLRCMKVNDTSINIYVGGGITKDSIAKDEWEETCIKSEVMKRVL
jgi:isochorismate synthase